SVSVTAGTISVASDGAISADTSAGSSGNAGNVTVNAETLTIVNGLISSGALAAFNGAPASTGNGGNVTVSVAGLLSIDGSGSTSLRGIATNANPGTTGNAGNVTVTAGGLDIKNNGEIASNTFATGSGGNVFVTVDGQLSISGMSGRFNTGVV